MKILSAVNHYFSSLPISLVLLSLIFIGWGGRVVYNLYFHPLSGIPGPTLWRASRLGFMRSLVTGNLVVDVKSFHDHYGDIVRTAPDEVSFAREDAWYGILSSRKSHKLFLRNATFFKSPPGQPDNLITTIDPDKNCRMRQVVIPAFSQQSFDKQESVIQSYTTLMIEKLLQTTARGDEDNATIINIVDWINWYTFDVIGELTLGESFGCLENAKHHPWVSMIFSALKVMAIAAATRYYLPPGVERLIIWMLPTRLQNIQRDHYATALDKIHRRIERKTAPADFMTPMLNQDPSFEKMSLSEIESTTALLLLAGSETTGTTICGTLQSLIQNPIELKKLETEIRSTFREESEITLSALQTLPFLNAVLNEGLRLCNPVAGGILRIAPKNGDTVCGHFIPEGTHVSINSIAMARSETNFHRHNEFLPSRFLPEPLRPIEYQKDKRGCLKPFGMGTRGCLGKYVALAEIRLVLTRLLWNFELSIGSEDPVDWMKLKTFIVVQKEPIKIRIRAREMSKLTPHKAS